MYLLTYLLSYLLMLNALLVAVITLFAIMQVHPLNAATRKATAEDVHIIWNELMAAVPASNACILGRFDSLLCLSCLMFYII